MSEKVCGIPRKYMDHETLSGIVFKVSSGVVGGCWLSPTWSVSSVRRRAPTACGGLIALESSPTSPSSRGVRAPVGHIALFQQR